MKNFQRFKSAVITRIIPRTVAGKDRILYGIDTDAMVVAVARSSGIGKHGAGREVTDNVTGEKYKLRAWISSHYSGYGGYDIYSIDDLQ